MTLGNESKDTAMDKMPGKKIQKNVKILNEFKDEAKKSWAN